MLIVEGKTDIDNIMIKWDVKAVQEQGRMLVQANEDGKPIQNFRASRALIDEERSKPEQNKILYKFRNDSDKLMVPSSKRMKKDKILEVDQQHNET